MREVFRRFAQQVAVAFGTPWAFLAAAGVVLGWALAGPVFGYSENWQLFINTSTTIITFLMVFVIQSTQNRDALVTQLKLDELLRAIKEARTHLVAMEELPDEELTRLCEEFRGLHERATAVRRSRTHAEPEDA